MDCGPGSWLELDLEFIWILEFESPFPQKVRKQNKESYMPEQETIERAREDKAEGKAPSTQAGEFVREEIAPHPRRQARRPLDQAGHRDRIIESAARGSEIAAAEERNDFGENSSERPARLSKRTEPFDPQAISQTFARDATSVTTRRPQRRLSHRAVTPGPQRGTSASGAGAFLLPQRKAARTRQMAAD
jgi:hypothetical protein